MVLTLLIFVHQDLRQERNDDDDDVERASTASSNDHDNDRHDQREARHRTAV